jgi:hypothetical protein
MQAIGEAIACLNATIDEMSAVARLQVGQTLDLQREDKDPPIPAVTSVTGNSRPTRTLAVQVRTWSVVSNARAHDVDLHLLTAFFLQGCAHGFDLLATRAHNGAWRSGVNRERHKISLIAPDINLSDGGVGIAPLNKRP